MSLATMTMLMMMVASDVTFAAAAKEVDEEEEDAAGGGGGGVDPAFTASLGAGQQNASGDLLTLKQCGRLALLNAGLSKTNTAGFCHFRPEIGNLALSKYLCFGSHWPSQIPYWRIKV